MESLLYAVKFTPLDDNMGCNCWTDEAWMEMKYKLKIAEIAEERMVILCGS